VKGTAGTTSPAWNPGRGAGKIDRLASRPPTRSAATDGSRPIRGGWAIDLDDLRRAVAFADPSAVLVPPRILRRVIKRDCGLRLLGGAAARQTSYVIPGAALGAIVPGYELGRPAVAPWPETVVLLAEPEPGELAEKGPRAVRTEFWRRLFRARVGDEFRRALASGAIDEAGLAARIEAIGRTEFEEVRSVLAQDGVTPPACPDAVAYRAFAAAFLDLSVFAPGARAFTFPAIEIPDAVFALLAADADVAGLLARSRPAGAEDPGKSPPAGPGAGHGSDGRAGASAGPSKAAAARRPPRGDDRSLPARARAAAEGGNSVRAAVLWTRSARQRSDEAGEADRAAARAALKQLASRLQKALFVRKGEAEIWSGALTPLLRRAAEGFWSAEARLLYDLQKVCNDHEREVYRVDVLGWLRSRGRLPLKRPLPHLREISMSSHLRNAARRLPRVRLERDERLRLEGLVRPAVHRAEDALRARFRPGMNATLDAHWVAPRGPVERVARRKLVEELLDRVVGRGFTTLGDLRDAASQSNLKMPDLAGPGEFFRGDRLLATDRALAEALEGVHRRGEIYLRWLQRLSALAFGTPAGRFFTRFVALPFGGSFVLLKGLEEIDELLVSRFTGMHPHLVNPWSLAALGAVALGAVNFPAFRGVFLGVLGAFGRVLRAVFLDTPAWLLNNPLLLRVVDSEAVAAAWRWGVKPGLVAAPVAVAARLAGAGPVAAAGAGVAAFPLVCFVFNTEAGRTLEEVAVEEAGRAGRVLAFNVVPGLFRLVMEAFERLLEWVEKLIYAVDEWLRFRKGQSRGALAVKGVLGLVWGVVAYLVRIYVVVLIEPQVNPIKHFPVVTVSHKVILPLSLKLTRVAEAFLTPLLGVRLGTLTAWFNVLLLPGAFGFLVWELKSNWRLYEANRPATLGPIVVGGHGETVVGLLRPGFHSGTLPKLYARLRKARREGNEKAALKRREGLHHVEESVRRFVERDFAALLHESRSLGSAEVRPGAIRLATNRVRVELLTAGDDRPSLWIDLEERAGLLAAGASRIGWVETLGDDPRRTLDDALVGLFKTSGVDVVHTPGGSLARARPQFCDAAVTWREWVAAWETEPTGNRPALPDVLPAPASQGAAAG